MRAGFFAFHKQASIDVLTGRMGAGKTSTADKLEQDYDLVVPTDFSKPKQPGGKYLEIPREEKTRIRAEKLKTILDADAAGKKVLVEGHPPGVVKLFRDALPRINKVVELDLPVQESFKRVLGRVEQDPDERDTMEEMDSAVDNNKKYDEYLKRIKDAGVPIVQVSAMVKAAAAAKILADQKVLDKVDKHLTPSETRRWQGFGKNLRSKAFVEAFKNDDRATPSQRRSAELRHRHLISKDKGTKVQGETGTYTVKYHPAIDRYTCSCNDFTYKKSGTPSGSCKHIDQARQPKKEQTTMSFAKVAQRVIEYEHEKRAWGLLTRAGQALALAHQGEAARRSGMVAKSVADAYAQNMPGGQQNVSGPWFVPPNTGVRHMLREIKHEALGGVPSGTFY